MIKDKEEKYKIHFRDGKVKEFNDLSLYVYNHKSYFTISIEYIEDYNRKLIVIGEYEPNIQFDISYGGHIIDINDSLRLVIKQLIGKLQMNPYLHYIFKDLS